MLCLTHRRTRDSRRTFRSEQTTRSLKIHKHTQVNKKVKFNDVFHNNKLMYVGHLLLIQRHISLIHFDESFTTNIAYLVVYDSTKYAHKS